VHTTGYPQSSWYSRCGRVDHTLAWPAMWQAGAVAPVVHSPLRVMLRLYNATALHAAHANTGSYWREALTPRALLQIGCCSAAPRRPQQASSYGYPFSAPNSGTIQDFKHVAQW
jgi:hypothetical protein